MYMKSGQQKGRVFLPAVVAARGVVHDSHVVRGGTHTIEAEVRDVALSH